MALTKATEKSISDNLSISGIATATNFKTGTTNVHNVGVEAAGINVLGGNTPIGTGATIFSDGSARFGHTGNNNTGIVTANKFIGDGSQLTGINADLVADTSPQLGGDLDVNGNTIKSGHQIYEIVLNQRHNFKSAGNTIMNINGNGVDFQHGNNTHADNVKSQFGASNDLQIYHDGTDSFIDNSTGGLKILGDVIRLKGKSADETMLKGSVNGAVELYHNNVKRFETDTDGVRVVAPEGAQAILRLIGDEGDDNNDYFRLNAGAGTLKLQDASNGSSWEDNIVINAAGSVELYHDNSKRFETTSTGTTITGNLNCTALLPTGNLELVDSNAGNVGRIRMGAGDDFSLYHNGNHSYIQNNTGSVYLDTTGNFYIRNGVGSQTYMYASGNEVALYHTGNKKFETTSGGAEVFGELQMDDANSHIKLPDNARIDLGTGADAYMYFDGTDMNIRGTANVQNVNIWTENVKKYQFTDGALRPLSNNSYDIGTSSLRWRNIYTNDLNLSNEGSTNDVDGTWGNYTIQEGESDLYLINNRNGKKYKFNLTEVS